MTDVSLGWLDMLKHEVYAREPNGLQSPIYVHGLRCGSPEAIARWQELARQEQVKRTGRADWDPSAQAWQAPKPSKEPRRPA